MINQDFQATDPFRTSSFHDADYGDGVTVPYAGQTRMRLTILSGLADARVHIDPDATDLIAILCDGSRWPRLRVSPSELRLSWPLSIGGWLLAALAGEHRDIQIVLHPAVEWTLQIRGGLSHFEADLSSGKLARLEIRGGVSEAHLDLPRADAVTPIRISGGVSDVAICRPADTAVALAVSGGVSDLGLDDQGFEAIGGGVRLSTGDVQGDAPRYVLEVSGGASGLLVAPR